MTEPDLIAIEGTILETQNFTTSKGDMLLEIVLEQVRKHREHDFHEYYPVTFWNEEIPTVARRGMRVRVLCRVAGRMNMNTGKSYVNLRGVSLMVLPDDPRPAA